MDVVRSDLDDLGIAAIGRDELERRVTAATGRPVRVVDVTVSPVDYPTGTIATDSLWRCTGTALDADGRTVPWRIFVKVLRSARVWPLLHLVPEFVRAQWVEGFPWRIEIDAARSRLDELMDRGMRMPRLYAVDELDDDHAAIWMEDVVPSSEPWDADRFARAARHLGVLAGRRPLGTDVVFGDPSTRTPGQALRMFVQGRVKLGAGPALRDPAAWAHPALVAALAHRNETALPAEMVAALERVDGWLDAADALPQSYVHGDASPQNLLVPADQPDSFVVIDVAFNSPQCVGFDLGQLLVGLVHAGELPVPAMDGIRRVIVPDHAEGLRAGGLDVTDEAVERGFLLATVLRSLFTAIPFETFDQPDSLALRELLDQRVALVRVLLGYASELG